MMKFLSTLILPALRRRTAWNIRFWIFLLSLPLAAFTANAQANTVFSGFTQSFDPASSNILFTTANTRGFFHVGDPIGLATIDGSPLNVFAWYGDLVYSGPATTLHLPAGHYFVEAPGDRNEFAVLPADWSTLTQVGWDSAPWPDPTVLALASFLKFGWVRGGGAWDVIQAGGSNSWDWTSTDQIVNAHHGLRKIEIDLEGSPPWILNVPTATWKVSTARFAQAFAQFAQAVAQRYSNQVDVVEVWNESNSTVLPPTNLTDQANLYTGMLAATRAAFPSTVKISGPVFNSAFMLGQAQLVATAGGGAYLDYDVFHDYEARNGAPDLDQATNPVWRTIPQRIQDNVAIFGKPIIVDEVGLYGQSALGAPNPASIPGIVENSGMSWTTGMTYAVKYAVMYAANNAILMPHLLLSGNDIPNNDEVLGFDANGRGPHPKTSAFLMSEYWVNGSTFVDWRSPGTNIFLYAWQRPDNTSIVFAWAVDGLSFPLSTNTSFSITDVYGRSIQPSVLDAQPVIFHANSPDAATLLQSVMAALPNLNLPPVLDPLGNQNVLKNQLLQFTVSATDSDNDPITYSADSLPAGATFDPTSGTFTWTPDSSQTGIYQITFTATDARGQSASAATLISVLNSATDGLIAQWKFDETSGTTASDSAGTDNGTLLNFNFSGASGWTTGKIATALSFDGVNDYVNLDSSKLSLSNNFSVSTWLNPRPGCAGVFFCLRSSYTASGFNFSVSGHDLIIQGQTATGWHQTYFAVNQIPNNIWSHVVVVYDKSTVEVYLNGVRLPVDYSGDANWGGDFVMNASGSTRIGAENGSGPVGFFYTGLIDDVRVYNRTLIPAEILAMYQAADQPPVLAAIGAKAVVTGQPLAFTLSASDPDNATLTFSASSLPSGASLNAATGAFAWTPSNSQTGTYNATFAASDGLLTNSQPTTITVSSSSALITVQANPSAGGTASGGGLYLIGATKQIAASPNSGWTFAGWNDGNSQNPRTVTVTSGGGTYTANLIRDIMPTTSGMSVTNPVMQFNNLAVVAAGDANVFAFDAGDWASNTLYYIWTFGDGDVSNRSTSSTPEHVYTNCGPYAAGVVVDDGVNSTNASFTVAVACQLTIGKLQANLNFARTNADKCTVKGAFDLPPDYSFPGKLVVLDIGGATVSFTLDSKGRGRNGVNTFNKPSYNKKTGLWTFNASLKNGLWQNLWATYGLANADVLKPGVTVSPPVVLVIDDQAFMEIPTLQYSARVNKSGTAK